MIMDLICEYKGEVIATGTAKTVEEFIFVDIPGKYTEVMEPLEFRKWLDSQENWKLA